MKKQKYNSQELGLISMLYMKGLFPKPKAGELLVDEGVRDGSCILYYEDDYFRKYSNAFVEAHNSGAFARSNSEDDWNDLLAKVLSAQNIELGDKSVFTNYWLTEA